MWWTNSYWYRPDTSKPTDMALHSLDTDQDSDPEYPRATLWLPDPSEHSGWSIRHVWSTPKVHTKKPLGFRK